VLEDKEFERIGGTRVLRTDFRLLAATNQNLEAMLAERRFRKDLFYRLNVIPLHIPPLRERRDDIPLISKHLLQQLAEEAALSEIRIDKEADEVLRNHDWPGNIRELCNVLERVLFSLDGDTIYLRDLPFYLYRSRGETPVNEEASLKEIQANSEKEAIQYALVSNNYKKAAAAKMLGIHRTLLYKKMKKYGIPLDLNGKSSST
jgi:transcriptional regulator with PAS, ATPase and Fis domain